MGLDPLLAGFQQATAHAKGFIIGVRSKHQPGAGRQCGRRKGQENVFRVQRHARLGLVFSWPLSIDGSVA